MTRSIASVLFGLATLPVVVALWRPFTYYSPYVKHTISTQPIAWALLVSAVLVALWAGPWVARAPTRLRGAARGLALLLPVGTIGAAATALILWRVTSSDQPGGIDAATMLLVGLLHAVVLVATFALASALLGVIARSGREETSPRARD